MSSTRQDILQALRDTRLVDPHSHINPHSPASTTLADILGYHYYTELVHSAGTPKNQIESSELGPRELVARLVPGLRDLTNTAQYAWLIDICQRFFGFEGDVIDELNWESLYEAAESTMRLADWADVVLEKSNVEAVFLTNDFDDSLTGFDTRTYVPCLRTDDLVFHLSKTEVRDRLAVCTGIDLDGSLKSVRDSLEQRFEHFVSHGARACAISLPPDFTPTPVSDGRASTALDAILRQGVSADASHKSAMARRVFWTIVELCDQFQLPMDLMIGVNRGVYAEGVHQGRDLYDSRVSLIQYRELFNTFPNVKFPISVLASVTNQELVSYAWIFPNVLTNGHWWYSNTPSFIRRDAAARLEAVPRNKQIGYYSDAYKLEFIAPKFEMYRNILAGILMDDFVVARGWSEEKAIELGRQILRGNVDTIFPARSTSSDDMSASLGSISGPGSLWMMPGQEDSPEPEAAPNDPHATLEIDPAWLQEELGAASQEADLEDEVADDISQIELSGKEDASVDLHATFVDEPLEFDLEQPGDDSAIVEDEFAGNIFADPATGELTMPVPAEESDDELDQTYLLSDEPESVSPSDELPPMEDVLDFDDLELAPMAEDDTDSLVLGDQLADDADDPTGEPETDIVATQSLESSPETEVTIDFDDDIEFTFDDSDDDASKS